MEENNSERAKYHAWIKETGGTYYDYVKFLRGEKSETINISRKTLEEILGYVQHLEGETLPGWFY